MLAYDNYFVNSPKS